LDEPEPADSLPPKDAVAALDNHRLGMLQLQREGALDPNHQRRALPGRLAARRAQTFRHGPAGVMWSDDVAPARDQLPLGKTEPPERAGAGPAEKLADRPRLAPPLGRPFLLRALPHRSLLCQSRPVPVETQRADPRSFASHLLDWYDCNARVLPWRQPPGSTAAPDPYRVWLAEVMLQQTTVEAAAGHFHRFVARWPTVEALAAAEADEVMAAWSGLGYYARARNLIACARTVAAAGGGFPRTEAGLRALPGVGPYTAAAVAALAFGAAAVPVDANLARVGARLFGLECVGPALVRAAGAAFRPFVPSDRPGDFAQALMDLGAAICRPRAPRCETCPLGGLCVARREGRADELPRRAPKRPRPRRFGTAWWVESGGEVALVRRPPRGLLGGLLGLPGTPWAGEASADLPFAGPWKWAPEPVVHGFTHFELHLGIAAVSIDRPQAFAEGLLWTPADRVAGLPTLFRKAVAVARPLAQGAQVG
jgi:A/G-specific adenine glycosylase